MATMYNQPGVTYNQSGVSYNGVGASVTAKVGGDDVPGGEVRYEVYEKRRPKKRKDDADIEKTLRETLESISRPAPKVVVEIKAEPKRTAAKAIAAAIEDADFEDEMLFLMAA